MPISAGIQDSHTPIHYHDASMTRRYVVKRKPSINVRMTGISEVPVINNAPNVVLSSDLKKDHSMYHPSSQERLVMAMGGGKNHSMYQPSSQERLEMAMKG